MKPESSVIFFPCKDINETKTYYTSVLELPICKDLGNTVWFDCGYGYLAFVQYGPEREMATGQCISFNLPTIEDVDSMYKKLQTRPVIGLKGAPAHHPKFPVYSFFFSDPNGYTLEYQRTTD
ncbi:MAG: VOC family protein [Lachnoclostridium sp.]|nr:VOC family protein [Lachnoclostridium sp.]